MIDVSAVRMVLLTVTSSLDRQERDVLAYLIEENRVLRRQLGGREKEFYICPQCLPTLIHKPDQLADKLPGFQPTDYPSSLDD